MSRARRSIAAAGVALAALFTAAPLAAAAGTTTTAIGPTTTVDSAALSTTTSTAVSPPTAAAAPTTASPLEDPFAPVPVTTPPPVPAATISVAILDFSFTPASRTVPVGTTVSWTNNGAVIHSVTSDTGAFDSSPSCPVGACIDPGGSYSRVFAQAGTFAYHCKVHPNMTGTVIVQAAAPTTTTASTVPGGNGNAPATTATTAASSGTGAELAFTGTSGVVIWLALGALATIAAGLALRPRRRPFPDPS